jgi:hypothetical protein
MAPDVTQARPLPSPGGTLLEVVFADGAVRHIDVATLARPEGVFADLFRPGFIESVRVNPDTGTIEWPSGADLSPECLYQAGRLVRPPPKREQRGVGAPPRP